MPVIPKILLSTSFSSFGKRAVSVDEEGEEERGVELWAQLPY